MSTATFYTTLGLVPAAAPEVIRAAYKALSLIYHPDKTVALSSEERVTHAAVFNQVQTAYDVLSKPSLKAAYDAELARHNNQVDSKRSTFHRSPSRTDSTAPSTRPHKSIVMLTTPEEKASARAKARRSIEYLRERRTQRDMADAQLANEELKGMVETYRVLAEENKADPAIHAYCVIRIHECEEKVADREEQHRLWLEKMSTAKQSPSTLAKHRSATPTSPGKPMTSSLTASTRSSNVYHPRLTRLKSLETSPTPATPGTTYAEERKRAETESHVAAAAARADARMLEKARRKATKQALVEQKAAAVRTDRDKQRARVELQARKDAGRIDRARAKTGAAPQGVPQDIIDSVVLSKISLSGSTSDGATSKHNQVEAQAGTSAARQPACNTTQPIGRQLCGKCGGTHASFREWRECNI